MTKKVADIKAKVGEYTNSEGATKGRWIDVGYVLEMDKGGKMRCYYPWINLGGIPRKDGHETVILSEFDVLEKDEKKPSSPSKAAPKQVEEIDEIPFD